MDRRLVSDRWSGKILITPTEESSNQDGVAKWLSFELYEELVHKKMPDAIVKRITAHHNNDASRDLVYTHYCVVEVENKEDVGEIIFIVKTPGCNGFSSQALLKTENFIIRNTISKMERELKKASLLKYVPLTPTLLSHSDDGTVYSVFEDNSDEGYSIFSPQYGIYPDECKTFLKYIGVFQTSFLAVSGQCIPEMIELPILPDSDTWDSKMKMIDASLQGVIHTLEKHFSTENWAEKIRRLRPTFPAHLERAYRRRPKGRTVLVHGLPNASRVLTSYKNPDGETRVRLRGFELARLGSVADDLLHFLYAGTRDYVLESDDEAEQLLEVYRLAFNAGSEKLGLKDARLTSEQLEEELDEQKSIALAAAFHTLPHTRVPGYLTLNDPGKVHLEVFENTRYKETLRKLVGRFESKGWLDGFDEPIENH